MVDPRDERTGSAPPDRGWSLATALIHHPYRPPAGFDAPQPGVFKASTVFFPSVAAMRARHWSDRRGYTYGLHGTPTSFTLQERLATLEGGSHCTLAPSGLAAIALVDLSLLAAGDEVLLPQNAYGPGLALARDELARYGIGHRLYDPLRPESLSESWGSRVRLVWVEAAGSVTMEFPDLVALVERSHRSGALVALDNTWGAGLAFRPFDLVPGRSAGQELGVDLSVHALTKYPSGGGDVLMGSVVTRDAVLHRRIEQTHMRLGLGVGANDVEAVLRGLPSLELRYDAQDAAARTLARWCARRSDVFAQVLHPALEGSPGHAHWRASCCTARRPEGRAAGLFSVIFDARYSQAQVDAFCDALRCFRLGYSWGGPVSLVMPYDIQSLRAPWPPHLARGSLVRFSVGLDAVEDLQRDLEQGLRALERHADSGQG